MREIIIKNGDLLKSDCNIIAHQINCVSKGASGFAKALFDKYPEVNVYQKYHEGRVLGNIIPCITKDDKIIIHMASQYYPTNVKYERRQFDNAEKRLLYFSQCLEKLRMFLKRVGKDEVKLGFPYLIGCGLAGGDWNEYYKLLLEFNGKIQTNITTELHKL